MLRKYGVIVVLLLLVDCNTSPVPSSALNTALPPTSKPTNTIRPPTITPHPSATHTPSPTTTALPTITSMPVPTLSADEQQALVRKMLQDNGGCELPCWWGVTPGKTDWETLRNQYIAYGSTVFDVTDPNHLPRYHLTHSFVNHKGIVDSIQVVGETTRGIASRGFAEDWKGHSLDQVMLRYGVPSQVQVSLLPATEPGTELGYGLTIAYDDLGFSIYYAGPATMVNTKTLACPIWQQVTLVVLQLQSPKPGTSVLQPISPYNKPFVHNLEDVSEMNLDAFYSTFKDSHSSACINLPTTWPQ